MKILLISHEFSRTGAPIVLLRILKQFKELGHDVTVWSLNDGPLRLDFEAIADSVEIIQGKEIFLEAFCLSRAKTYDFILCNTIVTHNAVRVFQKCGKPLVWLIQETLLCDQYFRSNPKAEATLRSFLVLYGVSDYSREYLTSRYNPNVRILMNFCEDTYIERSKKPDDGLVHFGILGTVHEVKGHDLLVDAFLSLPQELRDRAVLHIAGKMPVGLESFWEPLLQKTAGLKNVLWLGEISGDAKQEFFDTIDIIVVPSLGDPAPLTLMEACMQAFPAIVSRGVGNRFYIDETNGWTVETGSVAGLREALANAIQNKDRLKQMGKISRERYLATSTIEKGKAALEKLLTDNQNQIPSCPDNPSLGRRIIKTINLLFYKFRYKYLFRKETRPDGKYVILFGTISICRKMEGNLNDC